MLRIIFFFLFSTFFILAEEQECQNPKPPRIPRNFSWSGRYIVPDLIDPRTGKQGIIVPFTWNGHNGDMQMIAGNESTPIYFTNLIYKKHLYSYTYAWPGLQRILLPPLEPCNPIAKFSLDDLNDFFAQSFFVGPEILEGCPNRYVNHFRITLVLPKAPSGFHLRFAFMSGDIYVDQEDSSIIWKLLHFGYQNIYDPHLDEWIVIEKVSNRPGKVELPPVCTLP